MPKEPSRSENIGEQFQEALEEENINEQLRQSVLETMNDPQFALFEDEDLKVMIEKYDALDARARKETNEAIKRFMDMVKEYKELNSPKKAA